MQISDLLELIFIDIASAQLKENDYDPNRSKLPKQYSNLSWSFPKTISASSVTKL